MWRSPQYNFKLLAPGILFFASLLPATHEWSKLPEAASPKKDQPVFLRKLLLFMVLCLWIL
ncbi:hypothetical protein JCM10003_743 [Bacteroides pyogenes JCM 10003]|nr:hypothetical protein JCM10003_743 [Bacteroides pyogenes JCM 10003]